MLSKSSRSHVGSLLFLATLTLPSAVGAQRQSASRHPRPCRRNPYLLLDSQPDWSAARTSHPILQSMETSRFDGSVARRKIGPNFNPEVGFIERVDSNQEYAGMTFKGRPKWAGIRELQFEGFVFHSPNTHDVVQTQEWQGTFRGEFHSGAYTDDDIADVFTQRITTPLNIYKNVFIPNGLYHFARHQLTYRSRQDRRFTYNFFERFGSYYTGTLNEFRVRPNYRPTSNFSVSSVQ